MERPAFNRRPPTRQPRYPIVRPPLKPGKRDRSAGRNDRSGAAVSPRAARPKRFTKGADAATLKAYVARAGLGESIG